MYTKPTLLRVTTVPISLHLLITGQMRYFKNLGFNVIAVSANGPEIDRVKEQEGVEHVIVPFTRTISPIQDLICLWKMIRLIQKYRPDIIHTHTPKAGLLGMLAGWICKVPRRFHTVAGMPLMETRGFTRRILVFTERITYACATKVYPNSMVLKEYIESYIIKKKSKLKVLGNGSSNGIDSVYFSRTEEVVAKANSLQFDLGIQQQDFVWCFVGRLVGDKGIHELVEAFLEVAKQSPNQKLLLVGPYEDERDAIKPEIKQTIQEHSSIIAVGFQSDVRPYLCLSTVFVFPSYREGFPNVVLQAGAMELPAIVSDINGCNEIIENGMNGLVVPPKDILAIKTAMIALLKSEELRANLGRNARKKVVEGYSRAKIWEALLKEYTES